MHESSFSLLFHTRREVAELMAECPMCGAITVVPIEIGWGRASSTATSAGPG
jgi:hypothetical protein